MRQDISRREKRFFSPLAICFIIDGAARGLNCQIFAQIHLIRGLQLAKPLRLSRELFSGAANIVHSVFIGRMIFAIRVGNALEIKFGLRHGIARAVEQAILGRQDANIFKLFISQFLGSFLRHMRGFQIRVNRLNLAVQPKQFARTIRLHIVADGRTLYRHLMPGSNEIAQAVGGLLIIFARVLALVFSDIQQGVRAFGTAFAVESRQFRGVSIGDIRHDHPRLFAFDLGIRQP